jgi:hypothetical protein
VGLPRDAGGRQESPGGAAFKESRAWFWRPRRPSVRFGS